VPVHEQRLNLRVGSNIRSGGLAVVFGQTGALYPSSKADSSRRRRHTPRDVQRHLTASARLFDKRSGTGQNPILAGLFTPPTSQTVPPAAPGRELRP